MLCRLCAYECLNEDSNLLESNIKKLMAKYLYIEFTTSDEMPTTIICSSCLKHLQDFDDFSRMILERQKVLKAILENVIKLETIDNESNLESQSFSQQTTKHPEFTYATCSNDIEEDDDKHFSDKEDVLLLSELKRKISDSKSLKKTKIKRTTKALGKSKLKKAKEIDKIKVEKVKRQNKSILSPTEEKQRDELVAKYIALNCELCQEKTESYKQLQLHFQKVHKQKAFITCCGKRLKKRHLILDHVQFHVDPDQLKCKHCNKQLKTKISLQHHININHTRTNLQHACNICGKTFAYVSMLETHKAVHIDSRDYNCDICQKSFKTKNVLDTHLKHMHGERTLHICDICGKEYRYKISFEQHVAEHQGILEDKRKQCDICKVWVAPNYLRRHIQRHEKVDVDCKLCGKKFTSIPTLRSHKERYHNKNNQSYDCPYCEKKFDRQRYLKEHIDVHTGYKAYSCKFCPREFRSSANMYAHQKKKHHALWIQEQLDRAKGPEQIAVKNETK